jgi:hypothetical protein
LRSVFPIGLTAALSRVSLVARDGLRGTSPVQLPRLGPLRDSELLTILQVPFTGAAKSLGGRPLLRRGHVADDARGRVSCQLEPLRSGTVFVGVLRHLPISYRARQWN